MDWLERLQHDPSLQAFVSAEIARAGIELDTIRWQRDHDRRRIATLLEQLDTARRLNTQLRRRLGRSDRLEDVTP
jgi:hypothetical protein